jgi:hypothetical protein
MARLGRYFLPDQKLHVIQRGNNRGAKMTSLGESANFLSWSGHVAREKERAKTRYFARLSLSYMHTGRVTLFMQQTLTLIF